MILFCEKKNVKYTFQCLKTSIIVIQKFIIHKININIIMQADLVIDIVLRSIKIFFKTILNIFESRLFINR